MKKIILTLTVLLFGVNSFALKVLIVQNSSKQDITASGAFTITDKASNKKYKLKTGGTFKVTISNGTLKVGSVSTSGEVLITPLKNTIFTIGGNGYTGKIIISPEKNVFNIIEETDIENYLYGVLPYEMSYSWHIEALKAQAVAARTYTAKTLESPVNKKFDLYSDVRSQMYKGSAKVYPSVKEAVDDTKNEVLKYDGKLFYTYYHANCGGHTDPLPWGGAENKIKPLSGAKCAACGHSKNATWSNVIAQNSIDKFAEKKDLKGGVTAISIVKKTSNGRAVQLQLKTKNGKKNVSCNDFRIAVGSTKFKSCHLTDIKKVSSGFSFAGRGYGHGTGLCQDGAHGMAKKGEKYKEILQNFYPGSKLSKI
ncbi:Sporulation protein-like protein [Elusimicrobium minutum Pei191]|uniref:Sporulation protein-like protein n=1 Tax=Elusimicrobium minutum (strain Pei191) TaxID=445932 RepID=B2KCE1_ELUMP|nr:SpoIID/LytB domain-containing protein [Elusimicrobium minutum]ACC98062.1 Sporulation protein-like protein [Elusimicrobium minutum Pei191]